MLRRFIFFPPSDDKNDVCNMNICNVTQTSRVGEITNPRIYLCVNAKRTLARSCTKRASQVRDLSVQRSRKTSIYDMYSFCILHLTGEPYSHSFKMPESEECLGVSESAFSFELTVKRSIYVFIAGCKWSTISGCWVLWTHIRWAMSDCPTLEVWVSETRIYCMCIV